MKTKFWGIVCLLLAGAVVLNQLKIIPHVPVFLIVMTLVCGISVIKNLLRQNIPAIVIPSTILFFVYNSEYSFSDIHTKTVLLIAVLTYFGLQFLFSSTHQKKIHVLKKKFNSSAHYTTLFGENIQYVSNKELDVMSARCFCGEINLYFNEADMKDDTLTLNAHVICGSMKLFIPSDWKVINQSTVLFGEVDFYSQQSKIKTLIIEGIVAFGEIDIHYI
ncbi:MULTISPECIES: LiaF domain-containing protein [unclassified Granulicatella]|uniref:LiaF transmembrane domain-containing protein n=1 Tax=unclassified Granulicatella TaxID=2630493 RepID=UPI00107444D6|nr:MULTISPECIES: LiaF domain-containing protein [unclassified Granulicatella]MBF0780229.1 hypothetical protein [Granulicatella sp. 19428wC4_WM01]TFU95663.1 hypothetical protein E4T68_03875 [Granulicatella sp. WM01]